MADRFDCLTGWRRLGLIAFVVTVGAINTARTQTIVAVVNGDPIAAHDVEQCAGLTGVARRDGTSTLRELIDERLKLAEGRKRGIEFSDSDVDLAYGKLAGNVHMSSEQFTQWLAARGIVDCFKARMKAELVWRELAKEGHQPSLEELRRGSEIEMLSGQ